MGRTAVGSAVVHAEHVQALMLRLLGGQLPLMGLGTILLARVASKAISCYTRVTFFFLSTCVVRFRRRLVGRTVYATLVRDGPAHC